MGEHVETKVPEHDALVKAEDGGAPLVSLAVPEAVPASREQREESIDATGIFLQRKHAIQQLAFLDLKYTVEAVRPGGGGQKRQVDTLQVLKGITGQASSREMLALMGPSGSGKTSLLNVLAQRIPTRAVGGGVYVDGMPMAKSFKRKMGFVFQDDLCLWNLTVRETVTFAAKLRLPQSMPLSEKEGRVTELLHLLGLEGVANNIIGKETQRGVSGGERKRVSIGVELITSPDVLFLDEPTSGLDAFTALSIVNVLSKLAGLGMIVVCSIHQPRSNIFSKFDKVLLLDHGSTVFYGARGDILPYFQSLGLAFPVMTNPADWILDVVSQRKEKLPSGKTLAEAYQDRDANGKATQGMGVPSATSIQQASSRFGGKGEGKKENRWVTSFGYQLQVLLERQSKQSRGEMFDKVNVIQTIIMTIIASIIWFQSDSVTDRAGALFFVGLQQAFQAMSATLRVFPAERSLMIRERSTGSYRVGAYFLAKCAADLGLLLTIPLLFATTLYWCSGMRGEASAFVVFLITFLGVVMVGQSLGMFFSAAVPDAPTAQSIAFVVLLGTMLMGGFYADLERVPDVMRWSRYISFLNYSFGIMLHNEFDGREFPCADLSRGGLASDVCATSAGTFSGQEVLDLYAFGDVSVGAYSAALWGIFFFFRLASYLIIRRSTNITR